MSYNHIIQTCMHAPIEYAISKDLTQVGYKPTYGIPNLRVKNVHRIVQMCYLVAYTHSYISNQIRCATACMISSALHINY